MFVNQDSLSRFPLLFQVFQTLTNLTATLNLTAFERYVRV